MGFKLISKNGDFLPLLARIEQEDEDVLFYVSEDSDIYTGILPQVDNTVDLDIQGDDTVIFDMVGAGKTAETLKSKNYHVVGGGILNDNLELDRYFGNDFMREHGIQIPPTYEFPDLNEVEVFLQKNPDTRFVFKPNGNLETDLTIVPDSAEGLLASMPYLRDRIPESQDVSYTLQEFVKGVEMSTEAWFNGTKFLQPINSTMEEKKLMTGNIGPNTGCAGNVVWSWDRQTSEFLYEYIFKDLENTLREHNYVGPLDINGIWNENGIHGLEWTARFGYDAIQAYSRLFNKPLGKFLKNIRTESEMPVDEGFALSVRVSIPPYPTEAEVPRVPVIIPDDVREQYGDHIYLSDVCYKNSPVLTCAGTDGYILSVASHGRGILPLQREVYTIVDTIEIPSKQYRVDIGDRVMRERQYIMTILKKLQRKGLTGGN